MHTSLARRQRQRRLGDRRSRSGGGGRRAVGTVAIAIPLFLFGTFVLAGLFGLVGIVAAYNYYSQGLGDPKTLLENISFAQQTHVYDRSGQVLLASLGDVKRDVVAYDQIPKELIDATTSIEDKTFWSNAGFDPVGIVSAGIDSLRGQERGASTITQQLVRGRLLPASAFSGGIYERKIKEIIQSIRLTQEFPGEAGKQAIIAAYLNQNYYGNHSYGVAAAAQSYFGKPLQELSLAQMAILAGIPQSPSTYDLVANAQTVCTVTVAEGADCPADKSELVVPMDSPIVQRRNYILELMKTRAVLTAGLHTSAEYDAAMREPVVLAPQKTQPWKAAQFVWQVRDQLGTILCGAASANACEQVDTGGYQVITTLDWTMQQKVEKWLEAAARAPHAKDPSAMLKQLKIPSAGQAWIKKLIGKGPQNAAGAVLDARTGQILAYAGSAGYTLPGTKQFQPQFDVLSDGYRQPGSSVKPIDYSIGIDDHTMTAATLFMDVVTNFGTKANPYTPAQADTNERGPVRLREAIQFSLNVPAVKAGFINGLQHQFQRTQDFGFQYQPGTVPVASMSIGTLDIHPIDELTAYGTIANGGVRMPRQMILEIRDSSGKVVWSVDDPKPQGTPVISPQAAWIISDILNGNTIKSVNPWWAQWAVYDNGKRRDAGYKSGTTDENADVDAYGFLAPPADPNAPQLVVGVWMGNSDHSVLGGGAVSLEASDPLWGSIMTDVSHGLPFATFADSRPSGLVQVKIDAYSGMLPGPFATKTVDEWFIQGTAPTQIDNTKVPVEIDSATGDLWQDGCAGPEVTKGFLDLSNVEPNFPAWKPYTDNWIARARKGIGVVGGPRRGKTQYFYGGFFPGIGPFYPFGRTWGAPFAPTTVCQPPPSPSPEPLCSFDPLDPFSTPCPSTEPSPSVGPGGSPGPTPTKKPGGKASPTPSPAAP